MRLEAIALHGVKSCAEKTVIKIMRGITGIVGPNGCGKSNCGEAVRWALGEQSAKSLRGQKMEDLIFQGTGTRKAVGLAEVELLFSNDGTLAVPWSEIGVARRLFRTGESEYLLNRNLARLRDILDLFAGTGANPRAYSVMEQDKLNHVLTAKPHERRVFIEEAAGIARYKQQRNETQGKLDAARQNLVRVRDVMDEVKRQLGSLERQAKKAQQYKGLQAEKRELALALAAAEWMARVTEAERLAAEISHLRDAEQTLRTRSAGLAAREAQQRELREREVQLRGRAERLAGELSQVEAEAEGLQVQRARYVEARDVAQAELGSLGSERQRLAALLEGAERRLAEAEGGLANARVTLAARRSSVEALAELERQREGYGAGVRAVFGQGGAESLSGVIGTVADLLEVPPGMERALEAVLGERLQWVVVERFTDARAAVAYLQERSLGAATFLPLEHLPSPAATPPDESGVRWIARSVAAPTPSLVHYLLAQVAIVEHLDQAEALWRRNGVVATYVTPAGEVLSPTGRLRGGAEGTATPQSLLTRKRQLRELDEEVARLTETVDGHQATAAALAAEVATLRTRVGGLEQSVQARQAARVASEKDLEQSVREHERVHRHVDTIAAEARQVAGEAAATDSLLARLGQHVETARAAETRHDAALAALRASHEAAQESETALVTRLTSGRVELAAIRERADALR